MRRHAMRAMYNKGNNIIVYVIRQYISIKLYQTFDVFFHCWRSIKGSTSTSNLWNVYIGWCVNFVKKNNYSNRSLIPPSNIVVVKRLLHWRAPKRYATRMIGMVSIPEERIPEDEFWVWLFDYIVSFFFSD